MPSTIELKDQLQQLLRHIETYTGQREKSEWRRANYRLTWQVPAQVETLDSNETSKPVYVRIGTISPGGIDFLSPHTLRRGQKVLITLEADNGEVEISGTVVHSTDWFGCKDKLGVKFDLEDR